MIERIAQRGQTDCAICAVAMAMGGPYSYERVLADADRYENVSPEGKYYAWWEGYIRDERFRAVYRPFMDLYQLNAFHGNVVGLLGFDFPHLQQGHLVCVDEVGVIDPADGGADHTEIAQYILNRLDDGARFHEEFLAVERRP